MKKLLSLCLTMVLVLSLTGCSSVAKPDAASSDGGKVHLSLLEVNTDYSRNFIRVIQNHFPRCTAGC